MADNRQHENYGLWTWIGLAGLTLAAMLTAVCVGSVSISVRECLRFPEEGRNHDRKVFPCSTEKTEKETS